MKISHIAGLCWCVKKFKVSSWDSYIFTSLFELRILKDPQTAYHSPEANQEHLVLTRCGTPVWRRFESIFSKASLWTDQWQVSAAKLVMAERCTFTQQIRSLKGCGLINWLLQSYCLIFILHITGQLIQWYDGSDPPSLKETLLLFYHQARGYWHCIDIGQDLFFFFFKANPYMKSILHYNILYLHLFRISIFNCIQLNSALH